MLSTSTLWYPWSLQPITEEALKWSRLQTDCMMPVCQEIEAAYFIKPRLTSKYLGKSFVCKKQEVINLCYLELMRQKYCSDLDILLMMSDMVMSNMLTNFKGEQMEIKTCEERLSEVGLFSQKTGESRTM